MAYDGSGGKSVGRTALPGDVVADTSEERTNALSSNQVSFPLVEIEGFGGAGACRVWASGLVEDVRQVEQRVSAVIEEVSLHR